MAIRNNYTLTFHVKERFVQRSNKRYSHMQNCRLNYCEQCNKFSDELKKIVRSEGKSIGEEIYRRLNLAEEHRHYLNNTNFMSWYYEKYGYDNRFEFLVHEDILFVIVEENSKKVVVTCVCSKTHLAGRTNKNKFNKKEKVEEILL